MESSYKLANGPLSHDGVLYEGDDKLPALTDEQAAPLLAIGVIEPIKKPPAPKA